MRLACFALATVLAVPVCAEDLPKDPPITRISYWTTRPGKGDAANTFWKQFTPVFDEMKAKGLLTEWIFVTPEIHAGEDWDLAYIWRCRDWAAYGEADQYFSEAIAKMNGDKIETDFDAAFDGGKHRDEIWEGAGIESPRASTTPAPGIYYLLQFAARPGQGETLNKVLRSYEPMYVEMKKAGLIVEYAFVAPGLHSGESWEQAWIFGVKDMKAFGVMQKTFSRAMDASSVGGDKKALAIEESASDMTRHRDLVWKRVEVK